MILLGVGVWHLVHRQESRDESFKDKLDADDQRAEVGREEEARRRAEWQAFKDRQNPGDERDN